MKKLFAFLILTIALVSCYKSYQSDYLFNAVYFPFQVDVRTVVVGEGMKIKIGAELGGVIKNTIDRNVSFNVDGSLITPANLKLMKTSGLVYINSAVSTVSTLLPLPANYYTLSNSSTIVIKAGTHLGSVELKVDSAAFLADNATKVATYAIGLYITKADADSILATKQYAVIGLKYENMLFGNYWHGGVTTVKDASGTPIDTVYYYTTIPQPESKVWKLTTEAPNTLVAYGYSNQTSTTKKEILLTLNGPDITVSSAAGSTNTYLPNNSSTFNQAKLLQNRQILLNYKYVVGANTYYCQDTLTFRNRTRDGVNEWQDENPSHY